MENNVPLKRQREDVEEVVEKEEEVLKKQKTYKDIITLLEEEEDEPNQDLSSLISSLQDELSSGPGSGLGLGLGQPGPEGKNPLSTTAGFPEEEGERVMRHLLEASDDELGIPNSEGFDGVDGGHVDGGDLMLTVGEGLWEFEDYEAANYYSMLQSEIFM